MVEFIQEALYSEGVEEEVHDIRTFEEAMLLTDNKGLVVKMKDGSKFQITIVKVE